MCTERSWLSPSIHCCPLPDYGCRETNCLAFLSPELPAMMDCKLQPWTRICLSSFSCLVRAFYHCNKIRDEYSPYCGTLRNLIVEKGLYIIEMYVAFVSGFFHWEAGNSPSFPQRLQYRVNIRTATSSQYVFLKMKYVSIITFIVY